MNKDIKTIKKALEVWNKYPNFFARNFVSRVPVLEAYIKDKEIEYNAGGNGSPDHWSKETGTGYSFEGAPDKYRIASETTVIDLNGEKFEINIAKAKVMGLIRKAS